MKRLSRLTLRALLALTAFIAVFLAFYASRLHARKRAKQTVISLGGTCSATLKGMPWIRRLINDDDYFLEINAVFLTTNTGNHNAKKPVGDAELCMALAALPDPDLLTHLHLADSLVTDDGLSCLHKLPNLELFSLHNTLISDAGIQRLRYCGQLRTLVLDNTSVSDRGLQALVRLQRLRDLDLHDTRVTENGLRHLVDVKSLRRLDLRETEFFGSGFRCLAELPNLEELRLDDTEFGTNKATTARYLGEYADKMPQLRVLSLEDTDISDVDLQFVKAFASLEELNLEGTRVTDAGLAHICEMSTLKEVSLKKTGVTNQGVAKLRDSIPSCIVLVE